MEYRLVDLAYDKNISPKVKENHMALLRIFLARFTINAKEKTTTKVSSSIGDVRLAGMVHELTTETDRLHDKLLRETSRAEHLALVNKARLG